MNSWLVLRHYWFIICWNIIAQGFMSPFYWYSIGSCDLKKKKKISTVINRWVSRVPQRLKRPLINQSLLILSKKMFFLFFTPLWLVSCHLLLGSSAFLWVACRWHFTYPSVCSFAIDNNSSLWIFFGAQCLQASGFSVTVLILLLIWRSGLDNNSYSDRPIDTIEAKILHQKSLWLPSLLARLAC